MNDNLVNSQVKKFGGILKTKARDEVVVFNGREYEYAAWFDDDESADDFIAFSSNILNVIKSARDIIEGRLTLFFTAE